MTAQHKFDLIFETHATRQLGHTTLMQQGSDNYDKPFYLVAHTEAEAREIAGSNPNAIFVGLNSLDKLHKRNYPIIVDHHALSVLGSDLMREIAQERKELYNTILGKLDKAQTSRY